MRSDILVIYILTLAQGLVDLSKTYSKLVTLSKLVSNLPVSSCGKHKISNEIIQFSLHLHFPDSCRWFPCFLLLRFCFALITKYTNNYY